MEESLDHLKGRDVRRIDEKPRSGAWGTRMPLVHRKETKGVLIEICEEGANADPKR